MEKQINQYIEYKKTHITGWKSYATVLFRFASRVGKALEEVTGQDIEEYQEWYMGRYKPAGVRYNVEVIRGFLKYWDRRTSLSLFVDEVRSRRVPESACGYLEPSEMDAMEATCDPEKYSGLRKLSILMLLRDTGARVSEITNLMLSEVSQERCATILTRKSRRMRTIMWTARSHGVLMRYLGIRVCQNQRPYAFEDGSGKPACTRQVERMVAKAAKDAGITHRVTPHMYRHTKAKEVLGEKGIYGVQQVLGHANLESALKYLRLDTRRFMEMFGE